MARAVERGELLPAVDPDRAVRTATTSLYCRLAVSTQPTNGVIASRATIWLAQNRSSSVLPWVPGALKDDES